MVAFRRQFGEMKTSTERDMAHLRGDVTRAARSMHSACLNLSANMRSQDTHAQVGSDTGGQNKMADIWQTTFSNAFR